MAWTHAVAVEPLSRAQTRLRQDGWHVAVRPGAGRRALRGLRVRGLAPPWTISADEPTPGARHPASGLHFLTLQNVRESRMHPFARGDGPQPRRGRALDKHGTSPLVSESKDLTSESCHSTVSYESARHREGLSRSLLPWSHCYPKVTRSFARAP